MLTYKTVYLYITCNSIVNQTFKDSQYLNCYLKNIFKFKVHFTVKIYFIIN